MALDYVTLVLDLYDGKGDPVIAGTVTLSPNVTVTDSADHIVITQSPVVVNLYNNPVPSVQIVATDNDGLQPEGWAWLIQPQFPGAPAGDVYEVLFSNGAQQYLSDLLPATEGPVVTTYATAAALTAETNRAEAAEAAIGAGAFSVLAYGADPTGTADSTPAFNAAILAAVSGNTTPATTTRTAAGPVTIPAGIYKITSDLLIQSVSGFQFIGAGAGCTEIFASGTGFTTAIVNIDGSLDGVYGGFSIQGDGTEGTGGVANSGVLNGVNLTWTTAAARSTTGNTLRNIRVRALNFITGVSMAGIGSRQLDGTTLTDVIVTGAQTPGSWSSSGFWQYGFVTGNGTFGNIYDQQFYNSAAAHCYYGWYCNASGFGLFGAQPAGNGCDFYVKPAAQVTIENVQSQNAGQLLLGAATSAVTPCSMRDVLFLGNAAPLTPGNQWVSVAGGGGSVDWLLENMTNHTAYASGSPVMAFTNSGAPNKEQVTLVNVRQANSPSSGITVTGGGSVIAVNYIDTSTSPYTPYPVWVANAAVALNSGLAGATSASRWAGATASGAPGSGTFATGDFVIDRSGSVQVCTAGGSPGTWTALAAAQAPSVQWVTATGSYTWTKPANAQTVDVALLSGGAGGGSGSVQATGNAGGGGGGGGGGLTSRSFVASDLPGSVTGTVGAGGAGGTGVSGTTAASGNAGSAGANTTFGGFALAILASAGGGGTTAGGTAGAAGAGMASGSPGGAGGAAGAGTGTNQAGGATGGGGGGGASSGATANGGATSYSYAGNGANTGTAGVAGGASPGAGTQPAVEGTPSCGGGGGASVNTAGSAAQSGASAFYGGGGGGGGGAFYPGSGSAVTSGAGGGGGPGFALIITHFA